MWYPIYKDLQERLKKEIQWNLNREKKIEWEYGQAVHPSEPRVLLFSFLIRSWYFLTRDTALDIHGSCCNRHSITSSPQLSCWEGRGWGRGTRGENEGREGGKGKGKGRRWQESIEKGSADYLLINIKITVPASEFGTILLYQVRTVALPWSHEPKEEKEVKEKVPLTSRKASLLVKVGPVGCLSVKPAIWRCYPDKISDCDMRRLPPWLR